MDPVYDTAYYEDLAGRLYGLVIRLDDRLSADQAQWLHHVTEVGEYGLALDDMAAILAHGKIAITDQERRDLLALAERMTSEGTAAVRLSSPARRQQRPIQEKNSRDTTAQGHGCAPAHARPNRAGRGFRCCSQDVTAGSRQVQVACG